MAQVQPWPRPVPEAWGQPGSQEEGSAVLGAVAKPVLPQPDGSLTSWEGGRFKRVDVGNGQGQGSKN